VRTGAGNVLDCQHKTSRNTKLFHQEKPGKLTGKHLEVADQIQKTLPFGGQGVVFFALEVSENMSIRL
jgi:hypothetical protein